MDTRRSLEGSRCERQATSQTQSRSSSSPERQEPTQPSATTAWACAMPAPGTSTMPLKPRRQHALPGPSRCSIWRFSAGAKRPFFFLQFPGDNRSLSRPAWDKRKESSHNCVFTSVRSRRGFSTMTIGELRRRRQATHRAPCRMRGRPWACALRQVRKLYKNLLFAPFYTKDRTFAKTGSGRT